MFQIEDPTAPPDYQIDPYKSPFFQIMQPTVGSDQWVEVGFVWTSGTSRVSSTENWYLYSNVPTTAAGKGNYTWPGYDTAGRLVGAVLRLMPATPPAGQDFTTIADYLARSAGGATITYVKGVMSAG
jgi:hypothetical protein